MNFINHKGPFWVDLSFHSRSYFVWVMTDVENVKLIFENYSGVKVFKFRCRALLLISELIRD
jgi:hypothetical protein